MGIVSQDSLPPIDYSMCFTLQTEQNEAGLWRYIKNTIDGPTYSPYQYASEEDASDAGTPWEVKR